MPDMNPYASPEVEVTWQDPATEGANVWRQNGRLVMRQGAVLPLVCVKSNQPTDRKLRRQLAWHAPMVYLVLLLNLLIYIVAAMVATKRATIHVGLSDEWFAIRRRRILLAWFCFIAGVVLVVMGLSNLPDGRANQSMPLLFHLFWVGLLMILFGVFYGMISARLVVAAKITKEYIWLKGCHPDFLDRFPVFPHTT
jgi:hypothetical protein